MMDWMYKNSNEVVDREEYLLGKAIDKNFESQLSGSFNEVDKDITPASIFTNSGSNLQVDVLRKLKEDPLEQIRQKELETRKQLLKNPVKLKKLQNMLKANRDKEEMILKRRAKKKKRKSEEKAIDHLLASKYLQLKEKLGGKHLVDLGKIKSESLGEERVSNEREIKSSRKKKKKRKHTRSDSSSTSESSTSSSGEEEKYSADGSRKLGISKEKRKGNSPKMEIYRDECKPYAKKYGLEVRGRDKRNPVEPNVAGSSKSYISKKAEKKEEPLPDKRFRKRLTEEEKSERLKEMTDNVAWRKQLTTKNIKRYKDEQRKEKETSEKDYDDGFFRRQMAIATSHTTVQQRIKSNVNNIQRSERHMNEHFARR